jgi:hypothetical protein
MLLMVRTVHPAVAYDHARLKTRSAASLLRLCCVLGLAAYVLLVCVHAATRV